MFARGLEPTYDTYYPWNNWTWIKQTKHDAKEEWEEELEPEEDGMEEKEEPNLTGTIR